jgi:hypothetical protein
MRGERFRVLKLRRVSGVDTLVLEGSCLGTFSVPRAWTDQALPAPHIFLGQEGCLLEFESLMGLNALLRKIGHSPKKGIDK